MLFVSLSVIAVTYGHSRERTDFRVNTDGGTAEQNAPRIAVASDGSFVITWVDWREGTSDVYVQKFDTAGQPVGANQKINDEFPASYQFDQESALTTGNALSVVWQDFRSGLYPLGADIYLQSYTANFASIGANVNVTTQVPDTLYEAPDIAFASTDTGIVVWADYRNDNWDIYAQRVTASGTLVGANFRVNTDQGLSPQSTPRITGSADGWFVVVWADQRLGNYDIFGQRLNHSGIPIGSNVRISADNVGSKQAFPAVGSDLTGHFTVAWIDWRNGVYPANPDIYYARYDTTWTSLSGNTRANADLTANAQRDPSVAVDRYGKSLIVWADSTGNANHPWQLIAQMLDSSGVKSGSVFHPDTITTANQLHPDVALDGQYRYTTWTDSRNGNFDIYASIVQYRDPGLTVSPSLLQYTIDSVGEIPAAQTAIVTTTGSSAIVFANDEDSAWLSVVPSVGQTPETLTVSILPNSLPNGVYTAQMLLTDTAGSGAETILTVTLTVAVANNLLATPDTLYFSIDNVGEIPDSQLVVLTHTGTSAIAFSAVVDSDWVAVTPSSGATVDTLSISIVSNSLPNGAYQALITVSDTTEQVDDETILVVLTIDIENELLAVPSTLQFTIDSIGEIPPSQQVVVSHTGAASIVFDVSEDSAWLSVTPNLGQTPETLTVSVEPDSLPNGVYAALITLSDTTGDADLKTILVTLTVSKPIMTLSADTARFSVITLIDNTDNENVSLTNTGGGTLTWQATESASWLSLSSTSGTAPSTITFTANGSGLLIGTYEALVVFNSLVALQSPDTVVCIVTVSATEPTLVINPDTVIVNTDQPSSFAAEIIIGDNAMAQNAVEWYASSQSDWLTITPSSGIGPGTIQIGVTGFPEWPGVYTDTVTIVDSVSETTVKAVVAVNFYSPSADSVVLGDFVTSAGAIGGMSVSTVLTEDMERMRLFGQYDPQYVAPEAFMLSTSLPAFITNNLKIDSIHHRFELIIAADSENVLPAGSWMLGDLRMQAQHSQGTSQVAAAVFDTFYTDIFRADNRRVAPVVISGTAWVDNQTPVIEHAPPELPTQLLLHQNYPNPFNLTTVIPFSVPVRDHYRLEVFNILGSCVTTLVDEQLSAGEYSIPWNGLLGSGRIAPSGIYFYRLKSASGTHIRKMVLLK